MDLFFTLTHLAQECDGLRLTLQGRLTPAEDETFLGIIGALDLTIEHLPLLVDASGVDAQAWPSPAKGVAEALRQRQHRLGLVPPELLDALADAEVIETYITCAGCGARQVTRRRLRRAIALADSAEAFFAATRLSRASCRC
jgi:hypothetical protein